MRDGRRTGAAVRIQLLSDLHAELDLESVPSPDEVATGADIVIVAGDMAHAPDSVRLAAAIFPDADAIVMVGGNLEHYSTGLTIDEGIAAMRLAAAARTSTSATRVEVPEDETCEITVRGTAVRIAGATLWTDYDLFGKAEVHRMRVAMALNDYRAIRGRASSPLQTFLGGFDAFTTSENLARHDASRVFLADELSQPFDGPRIVVTHHLPSLRSVSREYRRDPISAGFASRCEDLLALGATMWVHGHTHSSSLYRDGSGTLVACNPAGYPRRLVSGYARENPCFDPKLVFDIRRGGPDGAWHAGRERKP
jgi:predicted phosphodiesterase